LEVVTSFFQKMEFNHVNINRLAWARCRSLCQNSHYLPSLKAHHIVSRYRLLIFENFRTEDIESLFNKAVLITYAASKDFQIANIHGYLLRVFDTLCEDFQPDEGKLFDKLSANQESWLEAKRAVEELKSRLESEGFL